MSRTYHPTHEVMAIIGSIGLKNDVVLHALLLIARDNVQELRNVHALGFTAARLNEFSKQCEYDARKLVQLLRSLVQ